MMFPLSPNQISSPQRTNAEQLYRRAMPNLLSTCNSAKPLVLHLSGLQIRSRSVLSKTANFFSVWTITNCQVKSSSIAPKRINIASVQNQRQPRKRPAIPPPPTEPFNQRSSNHTVDIWAVLLILVCRTTLTFRHHAQAVPATALKWIH